MVRPPANDWPGRFVVLEGIDGTGKTTLCAALERRLRAAGREVVRSFEPTRSTPHGLRLRELAASGREGVTVEEEVDLFVADRTEHLARVIRPALDAGRIVLVDRYFYSTMAYQGARGADVAAIRRRHAAFAPEPDLLVLLELDVDEALRRITEKRGSTPDAFEGRDYLSRVKAIFAAIEHPNLLRLDARNSTQRMTDEVLAALENI